MTTKITLSGMKFYGYHGCFKEEQIIGTHFLVDLSFHCDATKAVATDDIRYAIDYPQVYKSIKQVMEQHTHLIETLAAHIIRQLKSDFPMISDVRIKLCKLNPPISGQVDYVAVEMEENND